MPPPSIPSTTIPSSSASSPIWLPTSSSSPSPPPPFRPQPLLQALLPFVPILALTLLFLFLLRLILRHCLFLRLLFATDTHPTTTTTSSTSTSSASAQQSRVRQQLAAMESPRSEYNANEITPWMGNEPCDTPPLFLLNSPDMFFPVSGGGAAFLDPSAAAFWLDHQQLVHMLGPMPPKYDDAMKMRPSPPSMPIRPIRPLSIPSLQARGAVRPSDSSPPPCYELANQMPFRPQLGPILATRQQEHPPSYAGTTENSAAESNHHIGIPINNNNDGGVDDASGSVAIGLSIVAPIRRLSSLPPVEQLDRPCSSCSLASLQEAGSKQQQRQQRKMMATIGTFVAKHSSAGRHQRKEEEEEGEGQ